MIVKPHELRPDDQIVSVSGTRIKGKSVVVRVDKIDPGYIRTIEHRKGRIEGKLVVADFYDTYHPAWDIEIIR